MDFSTLVDLDDFFEDEVVSGAISDDLFGEAFDLSDIIGDEEIYEPIALPEQEPLPEFKPIEYETPSYGEIEETPAPEARVEELRNEVRRITEGGDKNDFMEYWKKLPDKDKDLLFRATMGALGGGAKEALRSAQQSRSQEFQRESMEREYAERRAREEREREDRRIAGTPQAMQFNVQPRGIIGQGMGS
jgi:hypothetical protein